MSVLRRASGSVRRLLSGDDAGLPDYVRRMSEPGDCGLFGPGSVVWRVHASTSTLLGGARALVLQTLEPRALVGVDRHSRFKLDPIGRLQNTARFVTVASYASTQQLEEECRLINRIHASVKGDADGTTYDATDPELLRYVHLSLVDSFLATYQAFSRAPLSDAEADAYVVEMNRLAPFLGFDSIELPGSVAEMRHMLSPTVARLVISPLTVTTLGFLRRPPLSSLHRVAYRPLLRAAVTSLDPQTRAMLPGVFGPSRLDPLYRTGGVLLVRGLSLLLGTSPALDAARRRGCVDVSSAG